jgi:hypothetical protein
MRLFKLDDASLVQPLSLRYRRLVQKAYLKCGFHLRFMVFENKEQRTVFGCKKEEAMG